MAKILIVEDDSNVVSFISTVLQHAGHSCLAASSAAQAYEVLNTESGINLLLLDHNLGDADVNGLGLLTRVRQLPRYEAVPVIICSGDSRPTVVSEFLVQKIAGFVKKPFRPERLLADVQRVLGGPNPASVATGG